MTDDTIPGGTEEPTVDDDEQAPHDADQPDPQLDEEGDDDENVDVPELRTRLAEAEAEAARYKRRLLASDLRKKQVEKELRDTRNTRTPKPDDDGTKPTTPDDTTVRENADLKAQLADLRVRRQFDDVTKYAWQNPAAAYRLLDLADVRQDDGTVDRDDLADAVDALAKDNPYLVKSTTPAKPRAERPSGQQPGTARTTVKPDHSSKFSVLRGRV